MGKKRIVAKGEQEIAVGGGAPRAGASGRRRSVERGILCVSATYNNTMLTLTDEQGGAIAAASSGGLGFQGAKKGTPFAAARVGEQIAQKAQAVGMKEVSVVVKGVGAGRESAIRSFINKGFSVRSIRDVTPVPHNGPRPPRARRV